MYASLTPPTTQVISVATADEKTLEFKIYQSDYGKQSVRTLTHATKYSTESLIRSIFILGNAEDLYVLKYVMALMKHSVNRRASKVNMGIQKNL